MKRDRSNQKMRTRKDLVRAAARLLKSGRNPGMSEVAEEAQVSRATAYRYFPNVEALLSEAPVDEDVSSPDEVFSGDRSVDPEKRVIKAEAMLHQVVYSNIPQLRMLLASAMKHSLDAGDSEVPLRQNRRTPLIEAALEPARERFGKQSYERLCASLAMIFGLESMVVFEDVLGLSEKEGRRVKEWAIRHLVRGALAESPKRRRVKSR